MKPRKLRNRLGAAASLGAAALAVALVGLSAPASASITVPPFPAASGSSTVVAPGVTQQFGAYPNWLPANQSVSNIDHSEGSDTTLFMMQGISNLYSQAGINPFSCTLSATANSACSSTNANQTQADLTDNYASTEELQGINYVGSGNGLKELCGSITFPGTANVDYSRSSKPPGLGTTCGTGTIGEVGYAKDAVIPMDFQTINPSAYMSTGDEAPGYTSSSFISYCQTATQPNCTTPGIGGTLTTAFPSTGIGNVAEGWEPTNSFTCTPTSNPTQQGTGNFCSGTPFTSLTNTGDTSTGSSGTGATSVAYRLFCAHGGSSSPYQSQIMDWGNLTNLSAAANGTSSPVKVGDGAPIGVPIRIIGVNPGSGTLSNFYSFAQAAISGGANCTGATPLGSSSNVDANAASGPNPQTNQGISSVAGANLEMAVENDVNQVGDFAAANWATPTDGDAADQAIDIATSLYFESLGVYSTNSNAQVTSIQIPSTATTGLIPSGQPGTFLAGQMAANGTKATQGNEVGNGYAMSRTLFNAFNTNSVRASTAGFLNWLCDSNSAFQKGTDRINGGNFDTDLTNLIGGQFGFQRLSDTTPELAVASQGVAGSNITGNVNGSCAANLTVSSATPPTVGSNTITLSANAPAPVQVGWQAYLPAGSNVATPVAASPQTVPLDIVMGVSGATITLGSLSSTTATVAAGSNGGSLASVATWLTPGNGELAVNSVSSFPSSGVAQVQTSGGNAYVAYTGLDTVDNYLTGVTFLSQSTPGAATTVSTGGTVTLLTAANLTLGSGPNAPSTLYFPGHPAILSVTNPNT